MFLISMVVQEIPKWDNDPKLNDIKIIFTLIKLDFMLNNEWMRITIGI